MLKLLFLKRLVKSILKAFLRRKIKNLKEKAFARIEALNASMVDATNEDKSAAFKAWLKKQMQDAKHPGVIVSDSDVALTAEALFKLWHTEEK